MLVPLSLVFALIVALRRQLFRWKLLSTHRLRSPVLVVGNISVGGTGKTPLVIWLAHALRTRGYSPGIVTRGYGGDEEIAAVRSDSDPKRCGDEALLLARHSGCPVWTGRDRAAAGARLLDTHPECDVVISDDGLQHYRLERDVEVAVIDGERRFGNGLLLPAGPLREPLGRLREVDAVVINGAGEIDVPVATRYRMQVRGEVLVNVVDPQRRMTPAQFARPVHAVAGIGNPQRFFAHLRALGLEVRPNAFPDHHPFQPSDLAFAGADPIVMTEKDAVKCEGFAGANLWFLPVEARVAEELADHVVALLRKRNGRQAA